MSPGSTALVALLGATALGAAISSSTSLPLSGHQLFGSLWIHGDTVAVRPGSSGSQQLALS